jgi:hypothetical protein
MESREGILMAQPIIIRPDYVNAMTKGLGTNLAYIAESKKGRGGRILRGGGGGEISKPQAAKMKSDKIQADLAKANIERNEAYRKRVAQEELQKQNIMAEGRQSEIKAAEAERKRQKDIFERLKGYVPDVTDDNYPDFYAFAGEQGFQRKGLVTPEQAAGMKPGALQKHLGMFFGLSQKEQQAKHTRKQFEDEAINTWQQGGQLTDKQQKVIEKYYPEETKKEVSATEKRQTAKDVATAEEEILLNSNDPAIKGQIDFFNEYANKPYIYMWKEAVIHPGLKRNEAAGVDKVDISTPEQVGIADIPKELKLKLLRERFGFE